MLGNLRDFMQAMPVDDPENALELIAQHIVRERMAVPAILFFETLKPVSFLAGQTAIVATPVLGSFIEPKRLERYATLLGDRAFVERLITRIESLEAERSTPVIPDGNPEGKLSERGELAGQSRKNGNSSAKEQVRDLGNNG